MMFIPLHNKRECKNLARWVSVIPGLGEVLMYTFLVMLSSVIYAIIQQNRKSWEGQGEVVRESA